MLKDKKLLSLLSVAVIIIVLIGINRPRVIDWSPSFSAYDKIPYGNYLLYNSLPDLFGTNEVSINNESPYKFLHHATFKHTSLIFIQDKFHPSETDTKELLSFVENGNSLFISARNIGGSLSDSLALSEDHDYNVDVVGNLKDSTNKDEKYKLYFTNPSYTPDSGYGFKGGGYSTVFDLQDTDFQNKSNTPASILFGATVLGTNAQERPVFVRLQFGNGYIYLHSYPFAFSNYYMLKPKNATYVAQCLSYLPHGHVIWDEYYKSGNSRGEESPIGFLLSVPALRWAYFTAIISLLFYILFNIKRRQRIIPVIEPYRNSTLDFVQTVGDLYYNQSDHKNICQKKINYLFEFIRNRYHLNTGEIDAEFMRRLSQKSGIEQREVEQLLAVINLVQRKTWISNTELLELNSLIETFKNKCH